ncbi:MAG: hypothetical protein EOO41_01055 [Methanobacteriota archaeon]|nr:MAG: hypothetical protein EOO41_01055 [Euryarchaeota archaeon]
MLSPTSRRSSRRREFDAAAAAAAAAAFAYNGPCATLRIHRIVGMPIRAFGTGKTFRTRVEAFVTTQRQVDMLYEVLARVRRGALDPELAFSLDAVVRGRPQQSMTTTTKAVAPSSEDAGSASIMERVADLGRSAAGAVSTAVQAAADLASDAVMSATEPKPSTPKHEDAATPVDDDDRSREESVVPTSVLCQVADRWMEQQTTLAGCRVIPTCLAAGSEPSFEQAVCLAAAGAHSTSQMPSLACPRHPLSQCNAEIGVRPCCGTLQLSIPLVFDRQGVLILSIVRYDRWGGARRFLGFAAQPVPELFEGAPDADLSVSPASHVAQRASPARADACTSASVSPVTTTLALVLEVQPANGNISVSVTLPRMWEQGPVPVTPTPTELTFGVTTADGSTHAAGVSFASEKCEHDDKGAHAAVSPRANTQALEAPAANSAAARAVSEKEHAIAALPQTGASTQPADVHLQQEVREIPTAANTAEAVEKGSGPTPAPDDAQQYSTAVAKLAAAHAAEEEAVLAEEAVHGACVEELEESAKETSTRIAALVHEQPGATGSGDSGEAVSGASALADADTLEIADMSAGRVSPANMRAAASTQPTVEPDAKPHVSASMEPMASGNPLPLVARMRGLSMDLPSSTAQMRHGVLPSLSAFAVAANAATSTSACAKLAFDVPSTLQAASSTRVARVTGVGSADLPQV